MKNSAQEKNALKQLLEDEAKEDGTFPKGPRGVIAPSPTRWAGALYVLQRYNLVSEQIKAIVRADPNKDHDIELPDNIMDGRLRAYEGLLFELERFIRHMEGDYPTLSAVPCQVRVCSLERWNFVTHSEF